MTDTPTEAEIVEAMRLAIAIRIPDPDKPDGYTAAQAALAAQRAMGLVLVPEEPTDAMLKAARNAPIPLVYLDSIAARQDLEFLSRYRAMIAAAQGEME